MTHHCHNCQTIIQENDTYCHRCGQKNRPPNESVPTFFQNFTQQLFSTDSRLWTTLLELSATAKVAIAYVKGQRRKYIHPLRLLVIVGAVMAIVLISTRNGKSLDLKQHLDTADKYEALINQKIDSLHALGQIIDTTALLSSVREVLHNLDSLQTFPIMISSESHNEVLKRYPKVASRDFFDLSRRELVEKYKVEGTWRSFEVAAYGKTFSDQEKVINRMISNVTWALILILPLLGALLLLIFRGKYPYLTQHLTLLAYMLCFMLIIFCMTILITYFTKIPVGQYASIFIFTYAVASFRDFYSLKGWQSILLTIVVGIASILLTLAALILMILIIALLT